MDMVLGREEVRVLGCLIEKEMATPEYYPLSLNALVNACNQKSNRDPVVTYDEETVLRAVAGLEEKKLASRSDVSRVPKYEERYVGENKFIRREAGIMCALMLRGPQTAGEIRARTERLHSFENLAEVNKTLEDLMDMKHVARIPRRPGQKEVRYQHLLFGSPDRRDSEASGPRDKPLPAPSVAVERVEMLDKKVESLSAELKELKQAFLDFKAQFE